MILEISGHDLVTYTRNARMKEITCFVFRNNVDFQNYIKWFFVMYFQAVYQCKITVYERWYHDVKSKSKERVMSIINLPLLNKFLISIEN